jgi:hypothetical protein
MQKLVISAYNIVTDVKYIIVESVMETFVIFFSTCEDISVEDNHMMSVHVRLSCDLWAVRTCCSHCGTGESWNVITERSFIKFLQIWILVMKQIVCYGQNYIMCI